MGKKERKRKKVLIAINQWWTVSVSKSSLELDIHYTNTKL